MIQHLIFKLELQIPYKYNHFRSLFIDAKASCNFLVLPPIGQMEIMNTSSYLSSYCNEITRRTRWQRYFTCLRSLELEIEIHKDPDSSTLCFCSSKRSKFASALRDGRIVVKSKESSVKLTVPRCESGACSEQLQAALESLLAKRVEVPAKG